MQGRTGHKNDSAIPSVCWPNGVLRLVLHAALVKNATENNAAAAAVGAVHSE